MLPRWSWIRIVGPPPGPAGSRIGAREDGGPVAENVKAQVTVGMLRLLVDWLAAKTHAEPVTAADNVRDARWLVVGFFGMLGRSELWGLRVGDFVELPLGGVGVWGGARCKTVQAGNGVLVCLADLSRSGIPVGRVIWRFVELRRERKAGTGKHLFGESVWGAGRTGKGVVTARLYFLLQRVGERWPELGARLSLFSAHSLRRGGAIAAAEAGFSREAIMRHGRWRSAAVDAYLQPSLATRLGVVQAM